MKMSPSLLATEIFDYQRIVKFARVSLSRHFISKIRQVTLFHPAIKFMKTQIALSLLIATVALTGCSTREMNTATENTLRVVAYPVTAPANAIGQSAPLLSTTEYVYWRVIPGTNTYEPYTTKKPLTQEEQIKLGILPPAEK